MNTRIPLIAGNWKMNLDIDAAVTLIHAIKKELSDLSDIQVLVAPPFTLINGVKQAIGASPILLGAQNMHWGTNGAFTGEISGDMLREAGCTHVILGHSERRTLFSESSKIIDKKVFAAVASGLVPIVCVGETLEERESGRTFNIIQEQLELSLAHLISDRAMDASTILAYEPVWAIGTRQTATPGQAQEVHRFIRGWLGSTFDSQTADQVRLLYGGSVKPENVKTLMAEPDIDGALVGGASLKAESFVPLIRFNT